MIARDIQASQAAGSLPRNRYRVTVQAHQRSWGTQTIVIWMWGRDEATEATIMAILNQYNRCEGRARDPFDGRDDLWHFDWRFEEHNVFSAEQRRADMQTFKRGELSYDALVEKAQAERARLYFQDTGRMPVDPYA